MKRYNLILISILVSMLVGCSKNEEGPISKVETEYYFRFKVDGIQQGYKYGNDQVNLVGSSEYNEDLMLYSLNISGIENIFESQMNTLTIFLSDSLGFSPGVNYSNIPGEGDDYPDFTFSMGYFDSDGNLFVAGGAGDNPMFDLYKPAFVNFIEIAETYITGTFSGELIWYDTSSGTNVYVDAVVISEGEFKVQRF